VDCGPNDGAAGFFIHSVLPLIRKQEPECGFWAVGHHPNESLLALDGTAGGRVNGSVPEVHVLVADSPEELTHQSLLLIRDDELVAGLYDSAQA
jgi:hypothetical protein